MLEVFLVIIVAAILIIIAARSYRYLVFQSQKQQLITSITLLQNALNSYYWSRCQTITKSMTVAFDDVRQYISAQNQKNIQNPWSLTQQDAFMFKIIKTAEHTYILQVSASTKYPALEVRENVHADAVEDNRLVWQRLPSQSISSLNTDLWVMRNTLLQYKKLNEQTPLCPV